MNRINKLPPSRRQSPQDWKQGIDRATRSILEMQQSSRPLQGASAFRASVIGQLRIALDREIPSQDLYVDQRGEKHVAVAEAIRILLGLDGFDWQDPMMAESVMLVAQRAIDDELVKSSDTGGLDPSTGQPWTWEGRLAYVIRMSIALERRTGGDKDPVAIRSQVLDEFDQALGEGPSRDWVRTMSVPRRDGVGTVEEACVQMPGLIRMVLGNQDINWYESANRASALEVVHQTLDDELGSP